MVSSVNTFTDGVTESPDGQLRLTLLGAALARQFDASEYEQYLVRLAAADPDAALASEIASAKNATYDQTPQVAFDTSSRQLLWAATLLRLASVAAHEKKRFSDTPFFRHIVNQPVFQQELLRYAYSLSDHFDRNKTRIRWGEPLSWFYFSPAEKVVNLDPFHSLVFGLPRHPLDHAHSRAPALHEVGHAVLSTELPKPFQGAIDRLKQLDEKTEPLTDAEKKEVMDNRIEAMLWGQFYNLAEDNVVNRFAIILGRYRQAQPADYAESLKYVYALINQSRKNFEDFKTDQWSRYVKSGRDFLEKMKSSSAIDQFNAITKVLGLSVPVNEGLFPNEKSEWEKSGLSWKDFMPSLQDGAKLQVAADILAEGDGTPRSISYQQPYAYRATPDGRSGNSLDAFKRAFRHLMADNTTIHSPEEIEEANKARNEAIERLWQKYVAPLLPQIKAEISQQMEQQAQQSQQQDMGDQIPAPPSSSLGSNNQNKQEKKQESDALDGSQAEKNEDKNSEKKTGQDKAQSAETGDEEKDSGNDAATGEQDKNENEGGDKNEGDKQGNGESGDLIQKIIDDAKKHEAQVGRRQREQEDQLESIIRQAQESSQKIKYDFPEGNWGNYQAAKQRLAWLTRIFTRQLEDIRKKQVEQQIRRGRQLEVLPDGGEMDRLDLEAQLRLVSRTEAYVPVREDDYSRFAGNKAVIKHTTPQMVLLIDGSKSMKERMNNTAGALPIDIAVSTGLALYEATNSINARVIDPRPAFECFTGIWGPNNPTWLTWPEIEPTEAGKNFDRFRNGLQSLTNLAPALGMVGKKLSTENSSAKNIGATHLLILSDGDIQDSTAMETQVIKLLENVRNFTVDVILISARESPKIVQAFRHLKGRYPRLNYGVHSVESIDQLPLTCLKALRQRLTQKVVATPRAAKAAQFKRATLA